MPEWSEPTRRPLPLILVRGFGGLGVEDEKRIAYQGFNDGTVYPQKRGENYIYEGLILRFMKSDWQYHDATNVVGYFPTAVQDQVEVPDRLHRLRDLGFFWGDRVVIDPAMALYLLDTMEDPCRSLWVFRYYDLDDRKFVTYGKALVRLIEFIRELAFEKLGERPRVNILAHSMGGLIVREAIQRIYEPGQADEQINKIVTLGTPHRGISFQMLENWIGGAADEMRRFNPEFQEREDHPESYKNFPRHFSVARLLTVVGTNYRSYAIAPSSWLNRLFSASGEFGPNYNRSDGLVKQINAQIPGAPRTFVHKCHGGFDSLVTARESFEVATRFFFGNVRVRLRLVKAEVTRGQDWFGKSEFFLGVSVKPRKVDFDLFHQSAEAENCYGPFQKPDFSDEDVAFPWADENRLIWEGNLDVRRIMESKENKAKDLVLRLDFYVAERDLFGIGFSDNVVYHKQYYARAVLSDDGTALQQMYRHTDERFVQPGFVPPQEDEMKPGNGGWDFQVVGTGFESTFRIELDVVPEVGWPQPIPR